MPGNMQEPIPLTADDLRAILPDIISKHVCTQKSAIELHNTMFTELRQAIGQQSVQMAQLIQLQSSLERSLSERMSNEFGNLTKELAMNKQAAELRHESITQLLKDLTERVGDIEETNESQQLKIQEMEQRCAHIEDITGRDIEELQLALKKIEGIMSPETIRFIANIKDQYESNKNRWVTLTVIVSALVLFGTGIVYFHNILAGGQKIIDYFREETKKSLSEPKKPEVKPKPLEAS